MDLRIHGFVFAVVRSAVRIESNAIRRNAVECLMPASRSFAVVLVILPESSLQSHTLRGAERAVREGGRYREESGTGGREWCEVGEVGGREGQVAESAVAGGVSTGKGGTQ